MIRSNGPKMTGTVLFLVGWLGCPAALWPQAAVQPAAQPPGRPATAPAQPSGGSLVYRVVGVKGGVRVAATGVALTSESDWSPVRPGDELRSGQQVHVPIRGAVKLVAVPCEPPTVLLIERSSLVNISELAIRDGVARSRMELGFGAIRAGVAEGTVRSDMEIKCPVATLSKRGTDIFRFEYYEGRFMMSLSEQGRGMIQAIQMESTAFGSVTRMRSRTITPGQFVTQQMFKAIDHVQFDRKITINDLFGLRGTDELFTMMQERGLGFLLPQGTNLAGYLDGPVSLQFGPRLQMDPAFQQFTAERLFEAFRRTGRRPTDGDFSIGQGSIPGILHGASRPQKAHETLPERPFHRPKDRACGRH